MDSLNPERRSEAINGCMEIALPFIIPPLLAELHSPVSEVAPTPASDEALMLRFRDGDERAFRALYGRYRAPLMRFAQHLTGRTADAEEIFQETWMAVLNARARYSVRAKFATWLFAIAHRRAADARRVRARRPTVAWADAGSAVEPALSHDAQPAELVVSNARQRALFAAIASLPLEQRAVFLLRAEAGLGLHEIASITRAGRETTKSRLRYALRELRKAMAAWV